MRSRRRLNTTKVLNMVCIVDGCDGKHKARGLCQKHYNRFKENGHINLKTREKGAGTITKNGYHQFTKDGTTYHLHVKIAEVVLGKRLPHKAVVHHVDGNKANNSNDNLVICQDAAYHLLLHQRQRAYAETGNAESRKCKFCKKHDLPENMVSYRGNGHIHRECGREYQRNLYLNRRMRND